MQHQLTVTWALSQGVYVLVLALVIYDAVAPANVAPHPIHCNTICKLDRYPLAEPREKSENQLRIPLMLPALPTERELRESLQRSGPRARRHGRPPPV